MEPDAVLTTDLRNRLKVIDYAEVRGACRRDDSEERVGARLPRFLPWLEECAPDEDATLVGRGPVEPDAVCRARAAQRAVTSAERLPIVPPGTKTPAAPAGSPARSAIQRSATFSA